MLTDNTVVLSTSVGVLVATNTVIWHQIKPHGASYGNTVQYSAALCVCAPCHHTECWPRSSQCSSAVPDLAMHVCLLYFIIVLAPIRTYCMYIFINAGDNHVCAIYNIHGRLLIQVNLHHDIIHRLDQLQLFFTFFLLELIAIISLFTFICIINFITKL